MTFSTTESEEFGVSTLERHNGVRVAESFPGSPAHSAGIRSGDQILLIDGNPTHDSIDLYYFSSEPEFEVAYRRNGKIAETVVSRPDGSPFGITPEDPPIRECANKCPFCFVDQSPYHKNLRPGLEIRDDDYRYSFLYGHYVTLTNLTRRDLDRIKEMRLSPLYISVHATDPVLRGKLLGRPRVEILPLLNDLAETGIEMHTQIVLWRGVNDGAALEQTVRELYELHPAVASVAIVPVGLTSYHTQGVEPWNQESGEQALAHAIELGSEFPVGFVQAADEWYASLKKDPPPIDYYGGMEVEANGVGMVRRLLDDWEASEKPASVSERSFLILTGKSPARYIERIVGELNVIPGFEADVCSVDNGTFGPQTTVTGLLGWQDLVESIRESDRTEVVIPDVMLDPHQRFLDNVTIEEARNQINKPLRIVEATAAGFASLLT